MEDEVLVGMPIAQYLRDCGYKVVEAINADEAIAVPMHPETVVDIVFSDLEMPGSVDGFGLAKWIREHRPGPAVLLTGTVQRSVDSRKGPLRARPHTETLRRADRAQSHSTVACCAPGKQVIRMSALFLPQAHPLRDQQREFVRRKRTKSHETYVAFRLVRHHRLDPGRCTRCLGIGT